MSWIFYGFWVLILHLPMKYSSENAVCLIHWYLPAWLMTDRMFIESAQLQKGGPRPTERTTVINDSHFFAKQPSPLCLSVRPFLVRPSMPSFQSLMTAAKFGLQDCGKFFEKVAFPLVIHKHFLQYFWTLCRQTRNYSSETFNGRRIVSRRNEIKWTCGRSNWSQFVTGCNLFCYFAS